MFRLPLPAARNQLRAAASTAATAAPRLPARLLSTSNRLCKKSTNTIKEGEVDEHARIFDPDARAGTAAAATSNGGDFAKHRPVDTSMERSSLVDATDGPKPRTLHTEHDGEHRPRTMPASADSDSVPSPDLDAGSGVDPGYTAPSSSTDPFPLPFSSGVDLNSPSQSDSLQDFGAPIRVPGREPGDETREQIIRRLIYQTRKRGILETDLLMSTFAAKELWEMPDAEIAEFDKLLDEPDWDIYYWLVAKKPVPDRWKETFETEGRLGARLRKHTRNEEKEVRWMPDEPPVEK